MGFGGKRKRRVGEEREKQRKESSRAGDRVMASDPQHQNIKDWD